MFELMLGDNLEVDFPEKSADLIYADCIYESTNFDWCDKYWKVLKNGGILQVQTDYHTVAQLKLYLDNLYSSNFVNWVIYKQEWGGTPKKGFPQKHDDILIYSKGKDFYWDKRKVEIPKKTAGTKFDKKGTGLKTPCSVFDDLGNFSTMSSERIKGQDGHNQKWQKPIKLMERLILPFCKKGNLVIDPFCGTGTTGEVCIKNGINFIGIESDKNVYEIANNRLTEVFENV
jgi:site-specific DNA-methyltransferase (adenine-specific)